jgi:hypothetical protein
MTLNETELLLPSLDTLKPFLNQQSTKVRLFLGEVYIRTDFPNDKLT